MDWTTVLPANAVPFLPVADGQPQDLPLFAAIGTELEALTCTGPEAAKFLQGQVTCDLNEITAGHLRLGAHCNPKGRAQASFLAYATPATSADIQTITLLLPPGMAEPTHQQLKKFALFSKVTLQTASGEDAPLAIIIGGTGALAWASQQGLATELTPQQITTTSAGDLITALGSEGRLLLLITRPSQLTALLKQLPDHTPIATQNGWWQCLTALGQVHIASSTQEEFIPQELNYDLTHGVSFKKGCYKGQEIIARLHFKGTPKFRTGRFQWQSNATPVAGASLFDAEGQRIGQIAQTAQTGDKRYEVLLVAKLDAPQLETTLRTEAGTSVSLKRLPLPYAV